MTSHPGWLSWFAAHKRALLRSQLLLLGAVALFNLSVSRRSPRDVALAAEGPAAAAGGSLEVLPGAVYSWSIDGSKHSLGRGASVPAGVPGLVVELEHGVVAVAAGGHSLAVDAHGRLYTFGRNDSTGGGGGGSKGMLGSGQLGTPRDARSPARLPGQVFANATFVAAAAGRYHSVALSADGRVFTFGLNDYGQLGRPARLDSGVRCTSGPMCHDAVPRPVGGLPHIAAIAAGRYSTLAVDGQGNLYVWGLDFCGRPDVAADAQRRGLHPSHVALPGVRKVLISPDATSGIVSIDTGYVHWVALARDGSVWTCATGVDGYAGMLPESLRNSGWRTPNADGELGRPTADDGATGLTPGRVEIEGGVSAVAAGRCSTMAVTADGSVLSWGCHLSRGHAVALPTPVQGLGRGTAPGPAMDVAAAEWSAAVLTAAGEIYIWGNTGDEQHGVLGSPKPLAGMPPGLAATKLVGGQQHFLATCRSGSNQRQVRRSHTIRLPTKQELRTAAQPAQSASMLAIELSAHPALSDVWPALAAFQSQYKSPCFWRDTELKCLPYASIIGVSKCGTTDLYAKLMELPGFVSSSNKGPHFWDGDLSFEAYLSLFDPVAAAVQQHPEAVAVDASSNTFSYALVGIRNVRNDGHLLPKVLHTLQPAMKLIVMLRDPIDRLYSAFWYYGCLYGIYEKYGMSRKGFHAFAEEQVRRMESCMQGADVWECASRHFDDSQQLVKGMYAVALLNWLEYYTLNQDLLVLNFDAYQQDEAGHISKVLEFLDVRQPAPAELARALARKSNRGHRRTERVPGCSANRPGMLPSTHSMLRDFYQPLNDWLADLLHDDAYRWMHSDDVTGAYGFGTALA